MENDAVDPDDDASAVNTFASVSRRMREMGWLSVVLPTINETILTHIETRVDRRIKGRYDVRLLRGLRRWIRGPTTEWLRVVLALSSSDNSNDGDDVCASSSSLTEWQERISFHMHDAFARVRVEELFSILRDFPDSQRALDDLRKCLRRTQVQTLLVRTLRDAFETRLLHPGVSTEMIITLYVASIRALRTLDPRGVLLEAVSEPIRSYLRSRSDTVRCIVRALTNESGEGGDLFEELAAGTKQPQGGGADATTRHVFSDEPDDDIGPANITYTAGQYWTPEPVAVDPRKVSLGQRSADIISTLVHIFGSSQVFVNEHQLMLADKLIGKSDFDCDHEVHTLELLKLRFGEESLHACEIMLKDMGDSRRVNKTIRPKIDNGDEDDASSKEKSGSVHVDDVGVTLISRHFWPPLQGNDTLKLHPAVESRLKRFADEYAVLRNPRILDWRHGLGRVEIELSFDDGPSREFRVSPELATVVAFFGDRKEWSATELESRTGLGIDVLTRRLGFWIQKGVLERDETDREIYRVVNVFKEDDEDDRDGADGGGADMDEDGGAGSGVASAESQIREQMKVYESYVVGMLTNFGSLPVDRIHNMLKMFVQSDEHKYDKSVEQLAGFLDLLVTEGRLECSGGAYSLNKKG